MPEPSQFLPSQDFLDPSFLLPNVGAPFVIGLAVGYCAKKMLRAALLLGGMIVVLFFITEYYGITVVNHQEIEQVTQSAMDLAKQSGGFLMDRLSRFTCQGVSAGAGFLAGLRMG